MRTDDGLTITVTFAIGVGVGGVMDIAACPATPSLTALTTAVPGATATIVPESLTVAIDWLGARELALASGLCVAGFRRVCLCRTPPEEACDPAVLFRKRSPNVMGAFFPFYSLQLGDDH